MDQFGEGHDQEILKKVSNEANRKKKPKLQQVPPDAETPIPLKGAVESGSSVNMQEKQPSANNRKKLFDSLAQIMKCDNLDMDQTPSTAKKVLVFPNRKAAETIDVQEGVPESTESIICTLQPDTNGVLKNKTSPADSGRKLVLDNVDIHQVTHDMTEQH
jgi:hypothetical protein